MGKLLCETNLRDVWCRNESVRAEIGPILQTHTHTHVSYSSIDNCTSSNSIGIILFGTAHIIPLALKSSVSFDISFVTGNIILLTLTK